MWDWIAWECFLLAALWLFALAATGGQSGKWGNMG